jgi:LPXTG-motif cell wall-anchored protein
MAPSRLVALLVALMLLVVPALALADSAGDNQYSDPFGGSTAPAQTAPQPTTAPAAPAPAQTSAPASSSSPSTHPATSQLPRTGLDLRVVASAGLLLLGGGLLLRRRLA